MARLTSFLGVVCRNCDAYNEPGTTVCISCGQVLGSGAAPPAEPPAAQTTEDLESDFFDGEPSAADMVEGEPDPDVTPTENPLPRSTRPAPVIIPPAGGQRHPSSVATPAASISQPIPLHAAAPAPAPLASDEAVTPVPRAEPLPLVLEKKPAAEPLLLKKPAPEPARKPTGAVPAARPAPPPAVDPFAPAAAPAPIPLTAAAPIPLATPAPAPLHIATPIALNTPAPIALGVARGTQMLAPQMPPAAADAEALSPGRARLVLERGEGFQGLTIRVESAEMKAGRSKGEILFPADPCLAPHQATFFYRDQALFVRDVNAPGGVFMRLRGVSVPLRPGDLFSLGNRLLRFAGLLPAAPPPPPDGTLRHGCPRPAVPSVLVEEWLEGGFGGRVYLRPGPSVTLGRTHCSVSWTEDPFLSLKHAEITLDPQGHAKLKDLGSTNGTFLRIPIGTERELADGDCVRLGREVLRVEIG